MINILKKNRSISDLISILIILVLVMLHFINPPNIQEIDSPIQIDKLAHFIMFFITSCWFFWIYRSNNLVLIILLIFLGLFLELLQQQFFVLRSFELLDWLADSIGVIVGFFTINKWI